MLQENVLETDIAYLKGIGPKRARILNSIGIKNFSDFLSYYPRRYLDRKTVKEIEYLKVGEEITVFGEVVGAKRIGGLRKQSRFSSTLQDNTGRLTLTWFYSSPYLENQFKKGNKVAVYGKVTAYAGGMQIIHPEVDLLEHVDRDNSIKSESQDYKMFNTGKIVSLYPTSDQMKKAGLATRGIRSAMSVLLDRVKGNVEEVVPFTIRDSLGLLAYFTALNEIHFPTSQESLQKAITTLKWIELFFMQLIFAIRQSSTKSRKSSFVFSAKGSRLTQYQKSLSFHLTHAQERSIEEIRQDMSSGSPMNRLLQGDVGSGKTVVAVSAMMIAIDNSAQCVFMAPTEILAVQHFFLLKKTLEDLSIKIVLLVGKQRKKQREEILASISSGQAHIIVGTHAIIEDAVIFNKLGLAVIDEQHRFGVMQRKALQDKSSIPHVLLMTATPIPRTLSMTIYGDLDISKLDEKPKNRFRIETKVLYQKTKSNAYVLAKEEIRKGRQVYVVFPLVEESEKIDLHAATIEFERLQRDVFSECQIGLIHGKMPPFEKEMAMNHFREGITRVLVGTTVIEVGVDVPNATVMIVEHAERFGLSQLHQLRGRVGRGPHRSTCFLICYGGRTEEAKQRLYAMEKTNDGFMLSEMDMTIRGYGNIMGTEQSGIVAALKLADIVEDRDILMSARKEAFRIIRQDPQIRNPNHAGMRKKYIHYFQSISSLLDVG